MAQVLQSLGEEQALELVFCRLKPAELLVVREVCNLWNKIASDKYVRMECFVRHWGLKDIQGDPKSNDFFEKTQLAQFVKKHIVARHDSVQSVSVKYGLAPIKLCWLNNMTSYHGIHSRSYLFVPVESDKDVRGHYGVIEYCPISCREVIVLNSEDTHTQENSHKQGFDLKGLAGRKLIHLLGKSKRIDENVAAYYLSQAQGDLRRAMQMYDEEARFDPTHRQRFRIRV
eukprot:TRINITY_DN1850_c0_g1_i10.p1 TRINITY_DN1850_c0_g1~~TRINITY_DN1850_c0_g1_i10.p1  ORF type:complete len:229 (+),score=22.47 TRINITY_DN1850_c0_g1_i10:241-927(+)